MTISRKERSRNWVLERHVDFDSLGDKVLNFTEHGEVVLGLDIVWIGSIQAGNESSERSDADTLTNTKHTGIDVCRASFQSSICVCNCCEILLDNASMTSKLVLTHSRIVMQMNFNVASHDTT